MTLKRFRVEVSNSVISHVIVAASTEDEAIEFVNQGQGEPGQEMPGDSEIISVTELDHE
jgi:hypothetical protein